MKKLGRYDLTRVLGKGAMGLVYEGRDPNLERRVAIKTIKVENLSDAAAAEYEVRFRTEARSAARLQHPNIVSVYDSDRDGDMAFLVMEFVEGNDLKHHLDNGHVYTLEQTLGIMGDLLSALAYAHQRNIVHRDIKPANLLVQASGRIKLTDFGVARIQDSGEATRTQGSIVGTLKYMSPEQLEGKPIDARADLFAAGVVLYQLLTGQRPFDGDSDFAVIQKIVSHTPHAATFFNPHLPVAIDAVVAKALAKSRDLRYSSALQFMTALQDASKQAVDITVAPVGSVVAKGNTTTWTATMMPGESLVNTQSGLGTVTGTGTSIVTQEVELVYWKEIKDSSDTEDIQGFLAKFPLGIYADLARRRLKNLGVNASAAMDKTVMLARPAPSGEATVRLANTISADGVVGVTSAIADFVEAESAGRPDRANRPLINSVGLDPNHTTPPQNHGQRGPYDKALPVVSVPVSSADSPNVGDFAATPALPAKSTSRLGWVAGLAILVLSGVAYKLTLDSGATAPLVTPIAVPQSNVSIGVTTETSVLTAAPSYAAAGSGAAGGAASGAIGSGAPASAVTAALAVRTAASGSSATVAAMRAPAAASKAASAVAVRKAFPEKDKLVAQEPVTELEKAASATSKSAAAPEKAASAPAASPRAACEDRILLGFQSCMQEQCAKPAFTRHPLCVERRAMEEQRREAERNR